MSFESVKDEVVAEIHALVAKLEALFHKAAPVQSPAPASAPVEVAAAQAVLDPVTNVAPHATNPTDGLFGKGATDPNYVDPRFPNGTAPAANSSFDPNKTALTLDDHGKNLHVGPGPFTRTLSLPDGYAGEVRIEVEKIADKADDSLSISLDGVKVTQDSIFPIGYVGSIKGGGVHTISGVASDNTFVYTLYAS